MVLLFLVIFLSKKLVKLLVWLMLVYVIVCFLLSIGLLFIVGGCCCYWLLCLINWVISCLLSRLLMVFFVNLSVFNFVIDDLFDLVSCFNKFNWVFVFSDGSFVFFLVSLIMLMLVLLGYLFCFNVVGSVVWMVLFNG